MFFATPCVVLVPSVIQRVNETKHSWTKPEIPTTTTINDHVTL